MDLLSPLRQPWRQYQGPAMHDPADLTATAAAAAIAAGRLAPQALREACLARIDARERVVRAFTVLDRRAAPLAGGPLHGLPIGVKDVLDTADLPTEYNSPIWAGYRPHADAAAVAWARAAGAVVLGKTVTTEFATRHPGPTTNPNDPTRTPGGSSSGSAAAVAAGFVPLAYGTQTAGSVIRPAAFCGVVGYKPSFGLINRHGMKLMAESLDTVGVIARSVADCALLAAVVSGTGLGDPDAGIDPPRIGLCWTPMRPRAAPETESLMERAAVALGRAGARVCARELPAGFDDIEEVHRLVMNAESARAMGWEMTRRRGQLSPGLRETLDWALTQSGEAVAAARGRMRAMQSAVPSLMEGLDVLLTPAAPGEAPSGLGWTGDPCFNLIWTALHLPCVTVPAGEGPSGMPLGIQLVGRAGSDALVLAVARWVQAGLG